MEPYLIEQEMKKIIKSCVAFVGVATWFRNGTATYPLAARAISSQTPMWWTANGVY